MVVDRGFEGCKQDFVTLLAPKGKKKSKKDGKTTVENNMTLTKLEKIALLLVFEIS